MDISQLIEQYFKDEWGGGFISIRNLSKAINESYEDTLKVAMGQLAGQSPDCWHYEARYSCPEGHYQYLDSDLGFADSEGYCEECDLSYSLTDMPTEDYLRPLHLKPRIIRVADQPQYIQAIQGVNSLIDPETAIAIAESVLSIYQGKISP